MKLTIGVKALNEEQRIAETLTSALRAAEPFGGEVVLADSGSTDRTVEIASALPVRVVQLADPSQRSCGAGAQLAFQQADGDYFYLMDGDMVLHPDFLPAAIAHLEASPELAAVGGRVREMNTEGHDFKIRAMTVNSDRNWRPGLVDRLDGGGLYRVSAIRDVGYFADRNLRAFEEFDLAARLTSRGWKLAKIDHLAVEHYGHQTEGYRMLWRRLKSGYAGASGEVLRGSLGRPHLPIVLGRLSHLRNGVAVMAWWALLVATLAWPLPAITRLALFAILLLAPLVLLIWRRGSLSLGLYSLVSWNVAAFGLIIGFCRRRVAPTRPLQAVTLSTFARPHD
ncbi:MULTISPECIES: glycosyltransferase family 2 protein [Caulobacter]|jgi:glycosyltransferase involved in cell wall biosynthesis|uniref:glycosyltransferase family 2 protein n=1 Tax=Caulobacter TaxID=75 RepID=UPI0006FFE61C|nr:MULTISPECIES: glycosyltransferase family 2 protein [Caulobacter]KQZ17999.1 glycosyl transferase [Caulobacter sp. Root1472]GGL18885.1 glycosyl transferase [Caulobacter rhizosphaerae]